MAQLINPFNTLKILKGGHYYYSLTALAEEGYEISKLPISIRIILESALRHCDGKLVKEEDVKRIAGWHPKNTTEGEIPFIVARVILQDFTGVPLVVDLAAMRDAVAALKLDSAVIEPQVPVDLVVDHSVQVDRSGTKDAYQFNLDTEFQRNGERYTFLKWGQQAFKTFSVVPPGIGIVHQVNLEHISSLVFSKKIDQGSLLYFDTLVGTDSHTPMVNGLGVLGWGVGGIEAEAAMLGQPFFMQMPEVIGVHLKGKLCEGVTATDLTLRITEILRKENVVDKFVEFFGEGAASLTVADRATIGNMAPEYGATVGYFPPDDKTLDYMAMTGRRSEDLEQVRAYLKAQNMYGIPRQGEVHYTKEIELDLNTVQPCISGPKRPQDRIDLPAVKKRFLDLLSAPLNQGGYAVDQKAPIIKVHSEESFSLSEPHATGGKRFLDSSRFQPWSEAEMVTNRPFTRPVANPGYSDQQKSELILTHGSVVIAAITSCTNTSNPSVMLAAGLLAKKAVERGLKVNHLVKTSLAPGSRVVTDYLAKTGLQTYLDQLGFQLVAYGCTTCIGNSGPLDEQLEKAIKEYQLVTVSVLSGNRNFEARIHSAVKANFLMSPPLVVAYALAGRIDVDLAHEPVGIGKDGNPVYLREIWPSLTEIEEAMQEGITPAMYSQRYAHIRQDNPIWERITTKPSPLYPWSSDSTYIQKPPYFADFQLAPPQLGCLKGLRTLAFFGDSVTTDHISPAGAFSKESPAGQYLTSLGVAESDFNSYGSRRGNHEVMMRGTFANVRIRNLLVPHQEGGVTKLQPEGQVLPIFDACQIYAERKVPLIIFAGKDYGMGSSRDWAAKGPALLGVQVVVARSFERIHRSNLIGMGILPLQFKPNESWESIGLSGEEVFSITGLEQGIRPKQEVTLSWEAQGEQKSVTLIAKLDTPTEVEYYKHGGILPYVLRQLLSKIRPGEKG